MSSNERVVAELAFDGGQIMGARLTSESADELEKALADRNDGALTPDAEDGRYTVPLAPVVNFRWRSAPFSAWLFRIAHNLAMDHFRASKRWQPEEDVPEPDPGEGSAAEEEALESIGRQSMLQLIEKLSREQQQVLTLKFVFNFSNADAATILDKTDGAIKSLQHRALASLQRQLERSGSAP